jgi:predicted transcriptional regulator
MNNNENSDPLVADLFLLFSRSTPWLILYSLRRKGMTLSEISRSLGVTQKAVLPELMALQRKNILLSFHRYKETYYRLADARILKAFDLIHKISQRRVKQSETESPQPKISEFPGDTGHESIAG